MPSNPTWKEVLAIAQMVTASISSQKGFGDMSHYAHAFMLLTGQGGQRTPQDNVLMSTPRVSMGRDMALRNT